jgi:hypothetical protein
VAEPIDELRRVASGAASPPPAMQPYLEKVRTGAFAVTDEDVDALKRAGVDRGRDLRGDRRRGDPRGPAPPGHRARGDRVRLAVVDHGHRPEEAAVLDVIRERSGNEPLGVVKTLLYRPELFGRPFSEALDEVMRGTSEWSRVSASCSRASPRY